MIDLKLQKLKKFIEEKGKDSVIVAFSGGVDSSTLAAICKDIVDNVVAVTVRSEVMPTSEIKDAIRIAKELCLEHYIIDVDLLSDKDFVRNTRNRCYFCKKIIIKRIKAFAEDIGIKTIFEGTNASDLRKHRPGYRAVLEEEDVYSPWVEAGITKKEIRNIAKDLGLSVYDKPASPCLATRIPFGESITASRLRRIEKAEEIIRSILGVKVVRVRDHGNIARIEVEKKDRRLFFDTEMMDKIAERLKKLGYTYVTLDLEGYREGSMLD